MHTSYHEVPAATERETELEGERERERERERKGLNDKVSPLEL